MKDKSITASTIKNWALRYLARYNVSTTKLKQHLNKKIVQKYPTINFTEDNNINDIINDIITEFTQLGYLNDALYTKNRIYGLMRKGKSTYYMKHDLKNKGIDQQTINNNLSLDTQQIINTISAINYIEKKHLGNLNNNQHEDKSKFYQALQKMCYNGYDYNLAYQLLTMSQEDLITTKAQLLNTLNNTHD